MAQGVLRVADAARGVLGDVRPVLNGGAAEESLASLLRPRTLCGGTRRSPLRGRDAVLAASHGGPRRHAAARRAAAGRAACIRAGTAILAGVM